MVNRQEVGDGHRQDSFINEEGRRPVQQEVSHEDIKHRQIVGGACFQIKASTALESLMNVEDESRCYWI